MARKRLEDDLKLDIRENGGKFYAYRSTSRMVDGRKITETVYLGRYDPDTETITPKRARGPKRSKEELTACKMEMTVIEFAHGLKTREYGTVYLLHMIQVRSRLGRDLELSFGPHVAKTILGVGMALAIEGGAFMHVEDTMTRTMIREFYSLNGDFSSGSLSEFTHQIGLCNGNMDHFFELRVVACLSIISWDSTTKGTYSDDNPLAEFLKSNKDNEDIPQVKKAIASDDNGIPLMFKLYPGTLSDMATLADFVETVKGYGRTDLTVAIDRGYGSGANINYLLSENISFVLPANTETTTIKSLMTEFKKRKNEHKTFEKHAYDVWEVELCVVRSKRKNSVGEDAYDLVRVKDAPAEAGRITAFVCYDTKKNSDEIQNLRLRLESISDRLKKIDSPDPMAEFHKIAGKSKNFFFAVAEGRRLRFSIRNNAVSFVENKAGLFVMLASKGIGWERMMATYDVRRFVEQNFDYDKYDDRRFRTSDPVTVSGREFLRFVALIMKCEIASLFRHYNSAVTSNSILNTMSTIQAVGRDDEWGIVPVTKKARDILDYVGLEVPKIAKTGVPLCSIEDKIEAVEDGA